MKFGKKPARPNSIKLKFADVIDATALPVPPASFGHTRMIPKAAWGILANDMYGDCVWAGAAHEEMLFNRAGRHGNVAFTDANVLQDYSDCTGFDPNDPYTDQGTDMQEAASYRRKVGIIDAQGTRHKVDAYCEIGVRDLSQLALGTWLFGATGIGVAFPESAFDQFERGVPFDVVPGGSPILGGHYMPCIGRHKDGHHVLITWGHAILATSAFLREYMDEAVCYLSRDVVIDHKNKTDEGFDLAKLDFFLGSLQS